MQLDGEGLATVGRVQQQWQPTALPLCHRKHQSQHRSLVFGELGPFAHHGSFKACASCSQMHGCLSRELGMAVSRCCWTKSWNWQKLPAIYIPAFHWELQALNGLRNSYTRQILQVLLLSRWERVSWCLLLHGLPGIFHRHMCLFL